MPDTVGQGGTIVLNGQYLDGTGALVDPVTPKITIRDVNNVVQVNNADPVRDATGRYHYNYTVPGNGALGLWSATWTGTINGVSVSGVEYFQVVAAGSIIFPPAGSYTTLAVLRAAPYSVTTGDASDDAVNSAIVEMSQLLDRVTGDHFAAEDNLTLSLSGEEGRYLFIPRRIRAITSVSVEGIALSSTFYAIHSSLNSAGTDFSPAGNFDALELVGEKARWPSGAFNGALPVQVVGSFSWASIPAAIARACAILVARAVRADKASAMGATRFTTETTTFERETPKTHTESGELSTGWDDVDIMIERYRHLNVVA